MTNAMMAGLGDWEQVVVMELVGRRLWVDDRGAALAGVAVPIVARVPTSSRSLDHRRLAEFVSTSARHSVDVTAAGATHPPAPGPLEGNVTTASSVVMSHAWGKPNSTNSAPVAATIHGDATKAPIFGHAHLRPHG